MDEVIQAADVPAGMSHAQAVTRTIADAALRAVNAREKTTDQVLAEMAAASRNAAERGTPPGTRAAIQRMKNKWCCFVDECGAQLGFVAPTIEFVLQFASFVFNNREVWSAAGRKGCGKATSLSAAYHLPKYALVELKYGGWVGLDAVALEAKSAPYKAAVLREYNRMVVGNGDVSSTGRIFEKKRWCGVLSNLAQDRVMEDTVNLTHTVMALTVIGFVEATCARAGAFATDRFDRRGLNPYWKDKVVLKLTDFKIAREGMEVTYDGVIEYDSKCAQVDFNRIKRHYYEKYNYGQSMTPDDAEVVRRSVSWMIVYLFRRGVFEAQWAGMGADARAAANTARASLAGYAGGMPLGALASAETAVRQIVHEGATAYTLEVQDEPLFVEFNSNAGVFLPKEMHSEAVGRLYGEVSVVLGLDPSHSGSYSGRRKHAVAVRKQCEARGVPIGLAKKSMAHKTTHGTMTKVYDDTSRLRIWAC